MADSPEGNPSIDNGRSGIIDWLWKPLFTMCGGKIGQKEMVNAKCNGLIDKQPEGRSLNDDTKSEANGDSAPTTFDPPSGWEDGNIDSSTDQIKLNDLPLPPLLEICKYLRADWNCKSLSNYRITCRATALAVNVFLDNQSNLPEISGVYVNFWEDKIKLVISLERVNYFMHPLSAFRDDINGQLYLAYETATITIRFDIENDSLEQLFEQAAQYLRGPVDNLKLSFAENANNKIDQSIKLLQNITFKRFESTGQLTSVVGSLALELLRKQCQRLRAMPKVFIASYFGVPSIFSPEFLTELDSLSKCVTLRDDYFNFPGVPNAFWQQLLMQKLRQGTEVLYWTTRVIRAPRLFTANSDLTPSHIRIYEVRW